MIEQTQGAPEAEAPAVQDWRDRVLRDPAMILEDRDVMRALTEASDGQRAGNIVDMRGIAMERLEARLTRLEDTHRTVVAAAYENLAGTNQVHRAVLSLLECTTFSAVLDLFVDELPQVLRVAGMRLVLESSSGEAAPHAAISVVPEGAIAEYVAGGRDRPVRTVSLRKVADPRPDMHGPMADAVRSEALLVLDLGPGRLPGMVAFAATDPAQFGPSQGTELLDFLAGVIGRVLRRHLA